MNLLPASPSPVDIEELFDLNAPRHEAWELLYKFVRGSSVSEVETFFEHPFVPKLKELLIGMAYGTTAAMWYSHAPDDRSFEVAKRVGIDCNMDQKTRTPMPLTKTRLDVLKTIWSTLLASQKQELWQGTWNNGLYADSIGSSFMYECINDWAPSSVKDTVLKISMLVGTMKSLGRMVKPPRVDVTLAQHTANYAGLLFKTLHSMKGRWSVDVDSVYVWRSLEEFPQFHAQIDAPHPWMLSLCVAWQHKLPWPPSSYHAIETVKPGVTLLMNIEEPTIVNPLNPIDHLLAKALKTMGTPNCVVAPEVQGLFGILDGVDNLFGAVLALNHPGHAYEEMDSALFEHQP